MVLKHALQLALNFQGARAWLPEVRGRPATHLAACALDGFGS